MAEFTPMDGQTHPRRALYLTGAILGVIVLGTLGFRYVLGWSWLDSLYMTVITITTVGYGEVHPLGDDGRALTIILMLSSVGVFAYALGSLGTMIVENHLGSLIWKRKMQRRIEEMEGHYIICGFGRTGRSVADRLSETHLQFVVLEQDPEKLPALRELGYPFLEGDASNDEHLLRAGVKKAHGLVAALGSDADNVYLVLSARQINPELQIISWASTREAEGKVLRAGANRAHSPYVQGGRRIVSMLTAPHALEFLDHLMGIDNEIRLGEFRLGEGSHLAGHSLKDAGIRRDLGVIIIGIRRKDGRLEFNPAADEELHPGDILIGIGTSDQMEKLKQML